MMNVQNVIFRIGLIFILMVSLNTQVKSKEKVTIWLYDFASNSDDSSRMETSSKIGALLETELQQTGQFEISRFGTNSTRAIFKYNEEKMIWEYSNHTNTAPKGVAIVGTWTEIGQYVRLNCRLISSETGSLIADYERNVGVEGFEDNLKLEIENLAGQMTSDLLYKRTPFGYAFNTEETGILFCDFIDSSANWQNQTDLFWTELADAVEKISLEESLKNIKVKRIQQADLKTYLVSSQSEITHETADKIAVELNAKIIVWAKVSGTDENLQIFMTQPEKEFRMPALQFAQLPPFDVARELSQIDFPTLKWDQRSSFYDFLQAELLFQNLKYSRALARWRNLKTTLTEINQSEASVLLDFYLGNAYLLSGKNNSQRSRENWGQARQAYQNALTQLKKHEIISPEKADIYNNLGILAQMQGKADSASTWLASAVNYAQEHNYTNTTLRAYHNLANVFLLKRQWKNAQQIYQASLDILKTGENLRAQALLHDNIGMLHQRLNNKNKAQEEFEKSLSLKQELQDESGIAQSWYYLGNVSQDKKDLDKALEHYLKCLDINLKLKNELQIAKMYNEIGIVHQTQGNLNLALEYLLKRNQLLSFLGDDSKLLSNNLAIADIYQQKADYTSALEFLENAQTLAILHENQVAVAQIYDKKGDIYNSLKDYDAALEAYRNATEMMRATNQTERLALSMFNMGLIHLKKQNYQTGHDLMKEAIDLDESAGFQNLKKEKPFLNEVSMIIHELNQ